MKYVLAALAVVAAIAALFFRPPHGGAGASVPIGMRAADESGAALSSSGRLGVGDTAAAHVARREKLIVYVAGEVAKPGVYALAPGARAQEALVRAGGPLPDADLVAVNLAAPVEDGSEIAVPKIGAASAAHGRRARAPRAHRPRTGRDRGHAHGRRSAQAEPAPQSVDLNSADEGQLETVPGIGPNLAARIVAYRETNGPFASTDELADVSGITPGLQEKIADFVVVR